MVGVAVGVGVGVAVGVVVVVVVGVGMNKLQRLIESAKAATPGPWYVSRYPGRCGDSTYPAILGFSQPTATYQSNPIQGEADAAFIAHANPATILKLCALLEKCEEALETCHERSHHEDYDLVTTQHFHKVLTQETLAAIKQWKGQT